jgi:hypothetical protein
MDALPTDLQHLILGYCFPQCILGNLSRTSRIYCKIVEKYRSNPIALSIWMQDRYPSLPIPKDALALQCAYDLLTFGGNMSPKMLSDRYMLYPVFPYQVQPYLSPILRVCLTVAGIPLLDSDKDLVSELELCTMTSIAISDFIQMVINQNPKPQTRTGQPYLCLP